MHFIGKRLIINRKGGCQIFAFFGTRISLLCVYSVFAV